MQMPRSPDAAAGTKPGRIPSARIPVAQHVRETVRLAAPLAIAQIAQIAMAATDTILLGRLSSDALAAGGLSANIYFMLNIMLAGIVTACAVLVSQARGAKLEERVPVVYWSTLLLSLLLAVPSFAILSSIGPLLRALDEPPTLVANVELYLSVLRWGVPATLISNGLMRSFLPALEKPHLITAVSLSAVGLNGLLNYALIYGAWGFPQLGLIGSATATLTTIVGSALALLVIVHTKKSTRRWIHPVRAQLKIVWELLRVGLPISVTYGVELALFLAAGLMIAMFGTFASAAHQMVLNAASITFMVPMSIGQAANVRVGYWIGAGKGDEARRAGFVATGIGALFMSCTALVMLTVPQAIVSVYLDVHDPANAATVATALGLLVFAALFQVADGVQVIAFGALRGLKDTKVPMLIASVGYWGIGFVVAWALAFRFDYGPSGIWAGLFIGLFVVAIAMILRFARETRPGAPTLVRAMAQARK
ncbi:MATE family efflux transporter [Roseiterribacter gracilis]|uniref:Multidrug-efflux transporter n=1 Tax=Roseiterribacter gracilis TaxID=2812848 RepID=A0A8S8XF93_9PROT|nr:putative multidrug resistance protein NorM [Rhodospirillales bacterium TMPK1]